MQFSGFVFVRVYTCKYENIKRFGFSASSNGEDRGDAACVTDAILSDLSGKRAARDL
jgi:hypothetical protein